MEENNKEYIINYENKTVSFKTKPNKWNMKIDSAKDDFMGSIFIRLSFYFKGTVNLLVLVNSMNEAFKDYEIFLTTLNKDINGNYYLNYKESVYFENLEFNIINTSINQLIVQDSLPNKIIEISQINGTTFINNSTTAASIISTVEAKTGVFKLTIANDGYSIGFNISHCLFDLTSIVYYFKYLSAIYINGKNNLKINKPILSDYSTKYNNNTGISPIIIKEYNYINNNINNLNYFYKSSPPNINLLLNNTTINIIFNLNEINKYISTSTSTPSTSSSTSSYLSKNDIITAMLFKLFTFTSNLNNNDIYIIRYIYNIRKLANIKEESLGNHFKYCAIQLKVSECRSFSINEIAQIVRNSGVNSINLDQYISDLEYFNFIKLNNNSNNSHKVYNYFYPSNNSTTITNWTQFDYNQINFGSISSPSSPYSIKSICRAQFSMNTIKFDLNENNEKIYTTSISIPNDSINNITQFSNRSKLFTIK